MPTKARSKLSRPGDVRPLHNGGGGPVYREWSVCSRSGTRSFLSFTAFRNNFRETPEVLSSFIG